MENWYLKLVHDIISMKTSIADTFLRVKPSFDTEQAPGMMWSAILGDTSIVNVIGYFEYENHRATGCFATAGRGVCLRVVEDSEIRTNTHAMFSRT